MSGFTGSTISELPLATSVGISDLIPITQGSSGPGTGITRRSTIQQFLNSNFEAAFGPTTISGPGILLQLIGTGAVAVPTGSSAQQPDTGNAGELRFNSDTGRFEFGTGGNWQNFVNLAGDTMPGMLTLGAAGTGLSVTNNALFGGSLNMATGPVNLANWTTALRPATPSAGATGFNTDIGAMEFFNGSGWVNGLGGFSGGSVPNATTFGNTLAVSGAASFTGAGVGLAVTHNATIGGTVSLANASTNFITATGSSGQATLAAAGSGSSQLMLRGLGSGAGGQVNIGSSTGGGALLVVGATANGGSLRFTQPSAAGTQMKFDMLTNTAGMQWNNVPTQFANTFAWSGSFSDLPNHCFYVNNTIRGQSQDPAASSQQAVPVSILNNYANFTASGPGTWGTRVWSTLGANCWGPTFIGLTGQLSQTAAPNQPPAWAPDTVYPTVGQVVINAPNIYRVEVSGTSDASGGPTGSVSGAIIDGTVTWSFVGAGELSTSLIGLCGQNTVSFNAGGTTDAAVGSVWGALFASQATSGATHYGESNAVEIDDYFQGSANKVTGIQLVRKGTGGTQVDWGISISCTQDSPAQWKNGIIFQDAIDANGYGLAFEHQVIGGLQPMAGAIDMTMVEATGAGPFGGGFLVRWKNGRIDNSGDFLQRFASLRSSVSGITLDVDRQELQSLSVTNGGADWSPGNWFKGSDGCAGTVATVSGTAIATANIVRPSQVTTPPATVTLSPMGANSTIKNVQGGPAFPTAATATPTYAAPATPTVNIGTGSATAINIGRTASATKITGNLGLYGATPVAKQTVTGSKSSGAALVSLLAALASCGLITDSTTA